MSDDDNFPTQPTLSAADRAATIDAMVAARGEAPRVAVQQPSQPLMFNTHTGIVRTGSGAQVAADAENDDVRDTGQNIPAEIDAMNAQLESYESRLNEVRYDPATGQPSFVVQGVDRERLLAEAQQFQTSANYQADRLMRLQAKRDQQVKAQTARVTEDAAILDAAGGDPAKATAIREAMKTEEVKQIAAHLVAKRGGR